MDERVFEKELDDVLQRIADDQSSNVTLARRTNEDKYKERGSKWITDAELIISDVRQEAYGIEAECQLIQKQISDLNDSRKAKSVENMRSELETMEARIKRMRPLFDVHAALEALETYENQRKRDYIERAELALALEDVIKIVVANNNSNNVTENRENGSSIEAINEEKEQFQLKGSMLRTLRDEVIVRKERLIYDLYEEWGETIRWMVDDKDASDRLCLNVGLQFDDIVAALQKLQLLEKKLDQFGKYLLNYILIPLLSSEKGDDANRSKLRLRVVEFEKGRVELTLTKLAASEDEKEETGSSSDGSSERAAEKLAECWKLFQILQRSFPSAGEKDNSFVQTLVDGYVLKPLKEFIVDFVLKPAVPSDSIDDPAFNRLLSACDNLLERMKASGVITEESASFEQFAANIDTIFLAKRCQSVLTRARQLIVTDLHHTVQVGGADRQQTATTNEGGGTTADDDAAAVPEPSSEKLLPPLSQFPKCRVSESVVSLLELIVKTLNEASMAEKPLVAARLYHCSRDMVELYLDLAAIRHGQQLKSVPQVTAIFYNNCHFMSHHLSTLHSTYETKLLHLFDTPSGTMEVTFVDFVPRLKEIAAQFIENQVTLQTQYLIDCLKPAQGFNNVSNSACSNACQKALQACLLQFQHVRRVCRQVLAPAILLKFQGKLCGQLLAHIVTKVSNLEDIAAKDAELLHQILSGFLKELESCFTTNNAQYIHRYCEENYYKYKEVLFILNASMAEIDDRWASGSGPLAHWMDPLDVKQLIRALFQNTDRRAALLAKIK